MEHTERALFGKLMLAMGELYHREISKSFVKLYWDVLATHCWQDVVKAFSAHVRDPNTGQFMPKPADIVRIIEGDTNSRGLQAWSVVEQAMRVVGPYRSVVFDDAITHAVIQEMRGWITLCQTEEKALPFVAKEFQARFGAYRYVGPTIFPRYLIGISEHQNGLYGERIEPPVLIGDKAKAKKVLEQGRNNTTVLVLHDLAIQQISVLENATQEKL